MLTCSKQGLPKIAMVFDTDVDIWDDQAVLAAMAYRYMPRPRHGAARRAQHHDRRPQRARRPGIASKIGMDCTVPIGPEWNPNEFVRSTVTDLGDPPAGRRSSMTEEALTKDMEAFIARRSRAPGTRSCKHYHGQPYPVLYRAFGNLRHKLGRTNDRRGTATRSPTSRSPRRPSRRR